MFRFSTGLASRWWPRSRWGLTPEGTKVYITNILDNTVSVIDTATNTVAGLPIPVGNAPQGVAITPDGTQAYVTNSGSNTVSVIKTANRAVVTTIPVGGEPTGVAFTPDGTHAYVANTGSSTVTVNNPVAVAVSPNGQDVYVAKTESNNKVRVIATATNTKVAAIPVGRDPMGLAIGSVTASTF
jgi:YVTN family beta-propeller protein